jgi:fumarate reductase flavoprotein subunit
MKIFLIIKGMNASYTKIQKIQNVTDSKEEFLKDTLKSGKGNSDEELANILIEKSSESVEFLQQFGVKLDEISQCGGLCLKICDCLRSF